MHISAALPTAAQAPITARTALTADIATLRAIARRLAFAPSTGSRHADHALEDVHGGLEQAIDAIKGALAEIEETLGEIDEDECGADNRPHTYASAA